MKLRDKIISESMKLFSLKGFLSASVSDILEATGTSKGGFYNHFSSKEDLFLAVLASAQKIWREKVLGGVREYESPLDTVKAILRNYRDQYLKDSETFPGGGIFITFSVELDDQIPHLAGEVSKGFDGFKSLLKKILDRGQEVGELNPLISTETMAETLFSSMIGSSVIYGVDKSSARLDKSIDSLIDYVEKNRVVNVAKM